MNNDQVKCTISGNACSTRDGAALCSCVGCTVWRSRESSVTPTYNDAWERYRVRCTCPEGSSVVSASISRDLQ